MGLSVGVRVGDLVGPREGLSVFSASLTVGASVGTLLGSIVGSSEGEADVGAYDGESIGADVGAYDGASVGADGESVGADGESVGADVGAYDGESVRAADGAPDRGESGRRVGKAEATADGKLVGASVLEAGDGFCATLKGKGSPLQAKQNRWKNATTNHADVFTSSIDYAEHYKHNKRHIPDHGLKEA